MSRIQLALFKDTTRAEMCRQRLFKAGIRAELHAELTVARFWFVSPKEAGIRLEVRADDSERARRLLHEWSAIEGLLDGAVRCPECRSFRVNFPQFTEKSLLTNLVMGLVAEVRLVEREYYCEDCHYMWSRPDVKPRRVRPHRAPNYFIEGSD